MAAINKNLERLIRSAEEKKVIKAVNSLPFLPEGFDLASKYTEAIPYFYYVARVVQDARRVYEYQAQKTIEAVKKGGAPSEKFDENYLKKSRYIHTLILALALGFGSKFAYNQKAKSNFDPSLAETDYKQNPTFAPYGSVLAAAGIETIIDMSETQDDGFDGSDERRGMRTYASQHGNDEATCVADIQLVDAHQITDGITSYYVRHAISEAAKLTAIGQRLEFSVQKRLKRKGLRFRRDSRALTDEDSEAFIKEVLRDLRNDREKSARLKTSSLIECAADCGRFYAGLKPEDYLAKAIMGYSRGIGLNHQRRNDFDDVESGRAEDVRMGILNCVMWEALKNPNMEIENKIEAISTLTRQFDDIQAIRKPSIESRLFTRPLIGGRRLSRLEEEDEEELLRHQTLGDEDLTEEVKKEEIEDEGEDLDEEQALERIDSIREVNDMAHNYGSERVWAKINEDQLRTEREVKKISPNPIEQRVAGAVFEMLIKG